MVLLSRGSARCSAAMSSATSALGAPSMVRTRRDLPLGVGAEPHRAVGFYRHGRSRRHHRRYPARSPAVSLPARLLCLSNRPMSISAAKAMSLRPRGCKTGCEPLAARHPSIAPIVSRRRPAIWTPTPGRIWPCATMRGARTMTYSPPATIAASRTRTRLSRTRMAFLRRRLGTLCCYMAPPSSAILPSIAALSTRLSTATTAVSPSRRGATPARQDLRQLRPTGLAYIGKD